MPITHATEFVDAARGAGVAIEHVYYNDEAHGFVKPENRTDFYRRVEKFLARSLAPQK